MLICGIAVDSDKCDQICGCLPVAEIAVPRSDTHDCQACIVLDAFVASRALMSHLSPVQHPMLRARAEAMAATALPSPLQGTGHR